MNQYNPYMNPYLPPNMNPTNQNVLPYQQILQVNGKASIEQLKMSPNSSVLIADSTAPIVWKCLSDSIGNVTYSAFDITPHKDEEQIKRDNVYEIISDLRVRIERLENESTFARRRTESDNAERSTDETDHANDEVVVEP